MSQADIKTMRDAYDAFNRGDIPAVTEAMTPDIEWNEPGGGLRRLTGAARTSSLPFGPLDGPNVGFVSGARPSSRPRSAAGRAPRRASARRSRARARPRAGCGRWPTPP